MKELIMSNKIDRDLIIEQLAQYFTDGVDLDSLMQYFYEGQLNYLNNLPDNEIEQLAIENNIMDSKE
jgi:hypothetical protein